METGRFRYKILLSFALASIFLIAPTVLQNARAEGAPGAKIKAAAIKVAVLPTSPEDIDLVDVGVVTEIKKSDLITLGNGRSYRLSQVRVPPPYEGEAIDYLKSSILNKKVGVYTLKSGTDDIDRYGNTYVHLMKEDGAWVQADLIARGLSWAYSSETDYVLVRPLYKYEAAARSMKAGFWKDPAYTIKNKDNIGKFTGSYQLYEGVISRVDSKSDGYTLLCDLSVSPGPLAVFIKLGNMKNFAEHGKSLLEGKWTDGAVRLRGWVEKGEVQPTIEVSHPEQVEFIDASGQAITIYN
jgi:hypothetical protein